MKYGILDLLDESLSELSNREQRNLLKELSSEIDSRLQDVGEEKDDKDEFEEEQQHCHTVVERPPYGSILNELKGLLNKYNAHIEAKDEYLGYPECGEDIHIRVEGKSEHYAPFLDIDLGSYFE